MRNLNLFIILSILLFFSACDKAQQSQENDTVTKDPISIEMEAIEKSLQRNIQIKGEEAQTFSIAERMEHYKIPGLSIAVIKDGQLHWAKAYGLANTKTGSVVDTSTLFQAGSISKPLAALAVLKLMEEGKVELDEDVNTYLKDWKIPASNFTQQEKVTLRRLLTHTAGTTVHGFPGYQQTDSFPNIEAVLNGEGNTPAILVDTTPGTNWRYSGGGYTIMEKVVEDVSGLPLEEYMRQNILEPMGLNSSTYAQPLPQNLQPIASAAYDNEGKIIEGLWHNYPEQAAAGLWTTPSDLAKYCLEVQEILGGKNDGILSPKTIEMMLSKDKNDWGLGPSLAKEGDSLLFQHGGKNAGFTNNMVAFAYQGQAIIVMTNADNGGALNTEITRAIANYYGWGLAQARIVERVAIKENALEVMKGRYKCTEQIPGVGDYYVNMLIKDGQLLLEDPNDNSNSNFTPLGELKFIDIETGDQIQFEANNAPEQQVFKWNNYYTFEKVAEEQ